MKVVLFIISLLQENIISITLYPSIWPPVILYVPCRFLTQELKVPKSSNLLKDYSK